MGQVYPVTSHISLPLRMDIHKTLCLRPRLSKNDCRVVSLNSSCTGTLTWKAFKKCSCLSSTPGQVNQSLRVGRGVKLIFTWGWSYISLTFVFKGLNVILGLYKCNYSLTVEQELRAASGWKQRAWPDKTRWRAGFSLWAL